MRGKLSRVEDKLDIGGLIPAHAGKTVEALHVGWEKRAHPRACGENIPPHGMKCPPLGSSPRMRGKPDRRS